jgi:hypothetical protein
MGHSWTFSVIGGGRINDGEEETRISGDLQRVLT